MRARVVRSRNEVHMKHRDTLSVYERLYEDSFRSKSSQRADRYLDLSTVVDSLVVRVCVCLCVFVLCGLAEIRHRLTVSTV